MAKEYGTRPSQILGIHPDRWAAYQIDSACLAISERIAAVIAETVDAGGETHAIESAILAVLEPQLREKRPPSRPVVYDLDETGALSWRYEGEAAPEKTVTTLGSEG